MRTVLGVFLALLLLGAARAQAPPECPGNCTPTTGTPSTGMPPVMIPGQTEGEGGQNPPENEPPVGDFTRWLSENPNSPLKNLAG